MLYRFSLAQHFLYIISLAQATQGLLDKLCLRP